MNLPRNAATLRAGVLFVLLAAAGCSGSGSGQPQAPGGPPGGTVEAGVVTLKSEAVPRQQELPGRVTALATAQIRPQVAGIVEKVVFKEGGQVSEGDVLYELSPTKFQALYDAAAAGLKKTEAAVTGAQATFDRSDKLAATKVISTQDLDDARTTLLQAQADQEVAKAELATAKINLDNATIKAPIPGIIGKSSVSIGALVTENQTDALATIRQVDPIYVDLVDSSANLLRIRDQIDSGTLGRADANPPKVTLTLEDGKAYTSEGSLSLADIAVSESTGTFSLRATFPNPDRVLMPGMFVRAAVDLGTTPGAFLVPQRAATRNDAGELTAYFVSADGKAELRVLTTSGSVGNDWVVTGGVKQDDRLIVDGLQKISNGTSVNPVEVTIDDNGVVKQEIKATGAAEPSPPGAPAQ